MIPRREHSIMPLALLTAAKAIFEESDDRELVVEIPVYELDALQAGFEEAMKGAASYSASSFELLAAAKAIADRVRGAENHDHQAGGVYNFLGHLVAVEVPLTELLALYAGIEEAKKGASPCGDSI